MESLGRGVWAITDKGRKRLASPESPFPGRGRAKGTPSQVSEIIPKLFPATAPTVKGEARSRLKPTGKEEVDFENSVWTLVYSLTPDFITVGRDPEIRIPNQTFRPDLLAFLDRESTALIIECKYTKYDAYVSTWISQLRSLKRELEDALKTLGRRNFVYVLAVQDKNAFKEHTKQDADHLRIKLVDQREIDYFRALQKACGIGIAHLFWGTIAPWMIRHEEKKLPALRVKTGKGREVYIFSVNAHDLLSRAFVSHRELHSPEEGRIGYQRMLQRKKLNETAKHIKKFKVFPTPIVVVTCPRKTLPRIIEELR